MHLSRRAILGAPLAAALTRCGANSLTPAQIVTEAGIVAKGLSGALTQVAGADPKLIPATTLATMQNDLTLAQGAAATLAPNLPAASGATIVQTVEGYVNAVLNTLAAPPINGLIPAPFNLAVAAAALLVPDLEAFVNQYLPAASAVAPATYDARLHLRAAAPQVTTLDQAVAILRDYAAS
jgi:hypothetical protein